MKQKYFDGRVWVSGQPPDQAASGRNYAGDTPAEARINNVIAERADRLVGWADTPTETSSDDGRGGWFWNFITGRW